MERIPPQRRPHYPPVERLAVLELRAARGWSLAQAARRLLVTPLTVASWNRRLDDEGPKALVQIRDPVSRFPEFVACLVRRLKSLCPSMGTRRIAVVERFIRSMKSECFRLLTLVPFRRAALARELDHYVEWFKAGRPHTRLGSRIPDEVYFGGMPASRKPRFEPRQRWPSPSACARPPGSGARTSWRPVETVVEHRGGRKHLPAVALRRAA